MKLGILAFCFFAQSIAMAAINYPLQLGIGAEYCWPDKNGLKNCSSESPRYKEVIVPLQQAADSDDYYGYVASKGEFKDLGYEIYVQVAHTVARASDDMITLKVTTWPLRGQQNRQTVVSEVFASNPKAINRILLRGMPVGNENFFSAVTLGMRASQR